MKEIFCRQNFVAISHHISHALLLNMSAGNCQTALVDKSRTIRKTVVTQYIRYGWLPCALTQ
jgi:hypothetical protein